jgi:hypothetical protein
MSRELSQFAWPCIQLTKNVATNLGCLDLTEGLEILEVPHQRLILLVILFDCIIILLTNAPVRLHHRCALQSILD